LKGREEREQGIGREDGENKKEEAKLVMRRMIRFILCTAYIFVTTHTFLFITHKEHFMLTK